MTKQDYIDITYSILKNDWDENPSIQFKEYSISQFQGTAFDSRVYAGGRGAIPGEG